MSNIPTPAEAREILSRFNASHFRLEGKEHARYRIPADPAHDDDIRLAAFIEHAERVADAAKVVLDGLHDRIDMANKTGRDVPVFTGIAELNGALK